MPVRRIAVLVSVALAALAAAALPALAAKSYRAEQYHVRVLVEPGGSVVVTETIRFAFGPDKFTYVYRDLPTRGTDGLTILDASMDGVPMERGRSDGQYELKREDNRRRILWHFPATSDAARTFTVTYRAAGVVWQEAESDVLAWTLLPTRHDYAIDCASGEVSYPAGTAIVAEAALEPPASEFSHEGGTYRFERCPFDRNASWVVRLRFAPRSVASIAPAWQQRSARNRENLPLFLGLGGLVLFAGVGGFLLFALNHRQAHTDEAGTISSPPDSLPPALAGTLLRTGSTAGWWPALGAVMDLARRGALTIQSVDPTGVFKSREVRMTRGPAPADAAPHERVLLDILFTDKHGPRTTVTFSELAKTFASSRNWKRVREAILADLRAERLLDADRERTRGRVTVAGLVLMAASLAGFALGAALFDLVGEPVLLLPGALLITGIVGVISGASFSPLSEEGNRRAGRWRAFRQTIGGQDGASAHTGSSADRVERWLPYAVAFGTAQAWMKRLQKQGVTVGPSWLREVSREGAEGTAKIGAVVAILSAGSSAGAHAGGHAGGAAGAAGGGASGAG